MTTENDEFRKSLVAAVQAELNRHASVVIAEVDRLRAEGQRERAELRAEFLDQVGRLSQAIEQTDARRSLHADKVRETLEHRLDEAEKRQIRRIDDATKGLDQMVQQAARPIIADLRAENEDLSNRVTTLDTNLRRFDEQAARMVTYFNEVTQQMETKQEQLAETVKTDVASQLATLKQLVEENDSAVRKFQNEVGQQVTQRLNDAEDRINIRLLASENRVKEESGQKIAEIDLHVSRVSGNLDDSLAVMNDRIAAIDTRFVELERSIRAMEEKVAGIDRDALEDLKSQMSTAAGEAMLVRIEVERFQQAVIERSDQLAVRLTEVETSLQDATMDVSTAVQLDRLEEIERALAELDPDQFLRKDGLDAPPSAIAPESTPMPADASSEVSDPAIFMMEDPSGTHEAPPDPMVAPVAAPAEAILDAGSVDGTADPDQPELTGRLDIQAIIAAAEAAHDEK